ncbi:hypothetical protein BDZ89DRAFT_955881, partial [Hymenopellis radicata]
MPVLTTIAGDKLLEMDIKMARAFAYKVSSHTTDADFKKTPFAFPQDPPLPGIDTIRTRIAGLAGITPQTYHCCVNSCVCFTGDHASRDECPFCQEKRYRSDGKPRKVFSYIPLIPRLVAFAKNLEMAQKMQYRGTHEHNPGTTTDIFDGELYRSLLGCRVKVGEKTMLHTYFESLLDIALGLSTDGFGPFKSRKQT